MVEIESELSSKFSNMEGTFLPAVGCSDVVEAATVATAVAAVGVGTDPP